MHEDAKTSIFTCDTTHSVLRPRGNTVKPVSTLVAAVLLATITLIAPRFGAASSAAGTSGESGADTDIAAFLADYSEQCRASVKSHFARIGVDSESDAAFLREIESAWCDCGSNAVSALPRPVLQRMARERVMPDGFASQLMQCTDAHVRPEIEAMCAIHARNAGVDAERYAPRCACIQRESDAMDIESLQATLDAGPIDFDTSFPNCPSISSP